MREANHLYLATDPDREGEAISWHVQEELEKRNALDGINVQRVVFHEITKSAKKRPYKILGVLTMILLMLNKLEEY